MTIRKANYQAVQKHLESALAEAKILAWLEAGNTGPLPEHAEQWKATEAEWGNLFEGPAPEQGYNKAMHEGLLASSILYAQRAALGIDYMDDSSESIARTRAADAAAGISLMDLSGG